MSGRLQGDGEDGLGYGCCNSCGVGLHRWAKNYVLERYKEEGRVNESSVFCQEDEVAGCLVGGIEEPRWRKRKKMKVGLRADIPSLEQRRKLVRETSLSRGNMRVCFWCTKHVRRFLSNFFIIL